MAPIGFCSDDIIVAQPGSLHHPDTLDKKAIG